MHPWVTAILVLLVGWMLVHVVRRVLRALVGLRVIEAATACACGYSMAGIPFGVCPECGRPHDATAPRPLGRPRLILAALLIGWTACVIVGSWGAFVAISAIIPPTESSRQSLSLNSTAGDIRLDWTIDAPRTNPQVDRVRIWVRESTTLPRIKPIHDSVDARDLTPTSQTPEAPAHLDALLTSIVDGAGELAPADRDALASDLRGIVEGALKGTPSSALVPRGQRAALYWGSGSGGWLRVVPRVEIWPFFPAGMLAWTSGAFVIVRSWEQRVTA